MFHDLGATTWNDLPSRMSLMLFLHGLGQLKPLQGCVQRKIEGSPVLRACVIQGSQRRISMRKLRYPNCPRAKVRCQGPLAAARAQPFQSHSNKLRV